MEMAFCRPLREIVTRLELLGFTLDHARNEYMTCAKTCKEEYLSMADEEEELIIGFGKCQTRYRSLQC
jgi:hypothetical protein